MFQRLKNEFVKQYQTNEYIHMKLRCNIMSISFMLTEIMVVHQQELPIVHCSVVRSLANDSDKLIHRGGNVLFLSFDLIIRYK